MRGRSLVRMYDVDSGRLLAAARNPLAAGRGSDLALSPDGSTVTVASSGRLFRFDADTLHLRGPMIRGPEPESVVYSHDGRYLLSVAGSSAIVWDARTGALLHRFA